MPIAISRDRNKIPSATSLGGAAGCKDREEFLRRLRRAMKEVFEPPSETERAALARIEATHGHNFKMFDFGWHWQSQHQQGCASAVDAAASAGGSTSAGVGELQPSVEAGPSSSGQEAYPAPPPLTASPGKGRAKIKLKKKFGSGSKPKLDLDGSKPESKPPDLNTSPNCGIDDEALEKALSSFHSFWSISADQSKYKSSRRSIRFRSDTVEHEITRKGRREAGDFFSNVDEKKASSSGKYRSVSVSALSGSGSRSAPGSSRPLTAPITTQPYGLTAQEPPPSIPLPTAFEMAPGLPPITLPSAIPDSFRAFSLDPEATNLTPTATSSALPLNIPIENPSTFSSVLPELPPAALHVDAFLAERSQRIDSLMGASTAAETLMGASASAEDVDKPAPSDLDSSVGLDAGAGSSAGSISEFNAVPETSALKGDEQVISDVGCGEEEAAALLARREELLRTASSLRETSVLLPGIPLSVSVALDPDTLVTCIASPVSDFVALRSRQLESYLVSIDDSAAEGRPAEAHDAEVRGAAGEEGAEAAGPAVAESRGRGEPVVVVACNAPEADAQQTDTDRLVEAFHAQRAAALQALYADDDASGVEAVCPVASTDVPPGVIISEPPELAADSTVSILPTIQPDGESLAGSLVVVQGGEPASFGDWIRSEPAVDLKDLMDPGGGDAAESTEIARPASGSRSDPGSKHGLGPFAVVDAASIGHVPSSLSEPCIDTKPSSSASFPTFMSAPVDLGSGAAITAVAGSGAAATAAPPGTSSPGLPPPWSTTLLTRQDPRYAGALPPLPPTASRDAAAIDHLLAITAADPSQPPSGPPPTGASSATSAPADLYQGLLPRLLPGLASLQGRQGGVSGLRILHFLPRTTNSIAQRGSQRSGAHQSQQQGGASSSTGGRSSPQPMDPRSDEGEVGLANLRALGAVLVGIGVVPG